VTATEFVVDRGYTSRAAWAVIRHPRGVAVFFWIYGPILLVLGLVFVALSADVTMLVVGVIGSVLLPAVLWWRTRALLARQLPVGTAVRAGFTETGVTVDRHGASTTFDYAQYREALRSGDVVLARQITGQWQVVPGILVSDADLRRFPRRDGS
jgi:hypothetical protein